MKRRRTLITPPLEWQMTAAPAPYPVIPVLAERGGTQLKTPKPVFLVDTRERNPFDFSRFEGWYAGIEKKPLKLGDYSVARPDPFTDRKSSRVHKPASPHEAVRAPFARNHKYA